MPDFKQIKEQVSIIGVVEMLGLKLTEVMTKHGPQLVGTCPISQLTTAAAFKVTPSRNGFWCFCRECSKQEKAGGDVIELVARMTKCSHREAAQTIASHFKLNGAGKATENASATAEPAASRNSATFDPLAYLKTLDVEHVALKDLDILPETLIAFQAGYASKGLNRSRLAVAWHDMEGNVTAFIGVALDGTVPQYIMPKGVPLPYWYGCHRVEEGQELRILPTLLDVLRAWESGCENCIAPLRPIEADAITSLYALMKDKSLILEI